MSRLLRRRAVGNVDLPASRTVTEMNLDIVRLDATVTTGSLARGVCHDPAARPMLAFVAIADNSSIKVTMLYLLPARLRHAHGHFPCFPDPYRLALVVDCGKAAHLEFGGDAGADR